MSKKRWISENEVRWAKERPGYVKYHGERDRNNLYSGVGNYGIVVGDYREGGPQVILNAGTPDWCFLSRDDCLQLALALYRAGNDDKFWDGRLRKKVANER